MGLAEMISLAALLLSGLGVSSAGVFALFKIGKSLGSYQATVAKCLEQHAGRIDDHEDRLRKGKL